MSVKRRETKRAAIALWAAFLWAVVTQTAAAQGGFGFAVVDADRLYDTIPSRFYDDSAYTPDGRLRWNSKRYKAKIEAVAAVLDSLAMPVVALRGVENESVVRDLVAASSCSYSYVHRTLDASDGLDCALLYFGDLLVPRRVESDARSLTVTAEVEGELFAFVVCRSRCELRRTAERLRRRDPAVKIVAAGHLADEDIAAAKLNDITAATAAAGGGNRVAGGRWTMADKIASNAVCRDCRVWAGRHLLDRSGRPRATFERSRYTGGAGRSLPVCCVVDDKTAR